MDQISPGLVGWWPGAVARPIRPSLFQHDKTRGTDQVRVYTRLRQNGAAEHRRHPPFVFSMSGTIVWSYFSGCMKSVANSLSTKAHIFRKVYFPRLLMPLAYTTSNLAQLFRNILIFFGFWGWSLLAGSQYARFLALNPVAGPVDFFRALFLGTQPMPMAAGRRATRAAT